MMSFFLEGEKVVQNFHVGFQCTGRGLNPLPPFLAVILTPVTSIKQRLCSKMLTES